MATYCVMKGATASISSLRLKREIKPQPLMPNNDTEPADIGKPEEEEIHFALPDLLPANHTLVVHSVKRILVLLYDEPNGEAQRVKMQKISPSGMRILSPLLQAYPKYCPYELLLTHLYPMPLEAVSKQLQETRETTMRPLRRAISTLNADLHDFGLKVTSIHSRGYVLEQI